jgi:hypothetical protein
MERISHFSSRRIRFAIRNLMREHRLKSSCAAVRRTPDVKELKCAVLRSTEDTCGSQESGLRCLFDRKTARFSKRTVSSSQGALRIRRYVSEGAIRERMERSVSRANQAVRRAANASGFLLVSSSKTPRIEVPAPPEKSAPRRFRSRASDNKASDHSGVNGEKGISCRSHGGFRQRLQQATTFVCFNREVHPSRAVL